MKFDVYIDGVRLGEWASASIVLDAQTGANATFVIPSAGAGPWYTNLSDVRITGRPVKADTSSWGFEAAADCAAWELVNLTDDGIDYTESAFGSGSWALDCTGATPALIVQRLAAPGNMNGLVFWAWLHVTYMSAAIAPTVYAEAYARDALGEWVAPRVALPEASNGWRAVGLRIAATYANPRIPSGVVEWGFRLSYDNSAGAAAFEVHLDAVNLCGRAYLATLELPPFRAGPPLGALAPYPALPCGNWDEFTWADGLAAAPGDTAWCDESAIWDEFLWADERYPTEDDKQWN